MHIPLQITVALLCAAVLSGCGKPVEPLPPEGFAFHAVLSAERITVGEPVTLTFSARHPAGSRIRFPSVGSGKEIIVQDRSSDVRKLSDEILESNETYQLTSFRIGDWPVATTAAICLFADGTETMQPFPERILSVQSCLNDETKALLSDIKDPVRPPLNLSKKIRIPLLVALLALLAGLLTLFFIRSRAGSANASASPLPPQVIARQALAALRSKPWIPDPFFTELSFILRTYLENRFGLNAPESTTEELTRIMAQDPRLKAGGQQTLNSFLTQADLVKFARADAEQDIMQTAFSTVEQFVDQTAPSESPAETD